MSQPSSVSSCASVHLAPRIRLHKNSFGLHTRFGSYRYSARHRDISYVKHSMLCARAGPAASQRICSCAQAHPRLGASPSTHLFQQTPQGLRKRARQGPRAASRVRVHTLANRLSQDSRAVPRTLQRSRVFERAAYLLPPPLHSAGQAHRPLRARVANAPRVSSL